MAHDRSDCLFEKRFMAALLPVRGDEEGMECTQEREEYYKMRRSIGRFCITFKGEGGSKDEKERVGKVWYAAYCWPLPSDGSLKWYLYKGERPRWAMIQTFPKLQEMVAFVWEDALTNDDDDSK